MHFLTPARLRAPADRAGLGLGPKEGGSEQCDSCGQLAWLLLPENYQMSPVCHEFLGLSMDNVVFNFYNDPVANVLLCPFYRLRHRGLESLKNLPKFAQVVCSSGFKARVSSTLPSCLWTPGGGKGGIWNGAS